MGRASLTLAPRSSYHVLQAEPPPASPCLLLPWLVREQPENRCEIQSQDKKTLEKVIWKMNAKHSIGEVLCFPTGGGGNKNKKSNNKKSVCLPKSSVHQKLKKKITQNTASLLLYWCQPLQDKRDEGVQEWPASPLPAVIPSIFLHAA